jgi:heme/copper-type cytochrome/quinol oxidase subunit 2
MENKMTEVQAQAESGGSLESQVNPLGNQKKKKASWLRTILWMLSMMLLVNAVLGIIAYFLFFYKK